MAKKIIGERSLRALTQLIQTDVAEQGNALDTRISNIEGKLATIDPDADGVVAKADKATDSDTVGGVAADRIVYTSEITSKTDANTLYGVNGKVKVYKGDGIWMNTPTPQGTLIVISFNSVWCKQIFVEPHGKNKMWTRGSNDTDGWSEWAEMVTQDDVCNPNLLDNPDFKINQRGKTEYSTTDYNNKYTLDRWVLFSTAVTGRSTTVKVVNSGFTTTETEANGNLFQPLSDDVINLINGKTCIMSAGASNGEVLSKTFVCDISQEVQSIYINGADNKWGLSFYYWKDYYASRPGVNIITQDPSIIVNWVKLELGSVATPFVPPNPATELLKCHRYYQRLCGYCNIIGSGDVDANNDTLSTATIVIPIQPLRAIPTVSFNGTIYINSGGTQVPSTEIYGTDFAYRPDNDCSIIIGFTIPKTSINLGQGCTAQFRDADSYIELSADL